MKQSRDFIFISMMSLLCTEWIKWIVENPTEAGRLHYYFVFFHLCIIMITIVTTITETIEHTHTKEG